MRGETSPSAGRWRAAGGWTAIALLSAAVAAGVGAEQSGGPPVLPPALRFPQSPPTPQTPTFRSRVDLVQVDVSVLDDQRRPVRGLKPSDFALLEDGREQEIVAFTEMAASDPEVPRDSWLRTVVPDVKVNNAEDGRLLLIIMDDANTPAVAAGARGRGTARGPAPKAAVKQVARAIIERMGPSDLASVIFSIKNRNEQEFTGDRDRLFAAIEEFSPVADFENYNNMRALSTFGDAAKVLGSISHRRKAVILISAAVPPVLPLEIHPAYVTALPSMNARRDTPTTMPSGVKIAGLAQDALRWAFRGNVTFYSINPLWLSNLEPEVARMLDQADAGAGASSAAARFGQPTSGLPPPPKYYSPTNPARGTPLDQLTGGFSIRTTQEFAAGLTQIFRESGSYYLLGYASPNMKDDGKIRRIEVRLRDRPFAVRSRAAFIPPKHERVRAPASPLWGALSGLTPAKDVALRVNVAPFAVPGKTEVALAITLGLRQAVGSADAPPVQETVNLLIQAFTPSGKRQGRPRYQAVDLHLRPNASGEVKYEVLSRLDLKPGRYHIRMSAQSRAMGKSGSIYHDIDIPDFSKLPLSLSGIVVSATPDLLSGPRELLAKLLPVVPTTQREFAGHQGRAFARVYQGERAPIVPVTVSARIVDADQLVVFEAADAIGIDRFTRDRAADYSLSLPTTDLLPGVYLLTVVARAGDLTFSRDVRFTVSARSDGAAR